MLLRFQQINKVIKNSHPLFPKLCLGKECLKLCFKNAKQSFAFFHSQTEFGHEVAEFGNDMKLSLACMMEYRNSGILE